MGRTSAGRAAPGAAPGFIHGLSGADWRRSSMDMTKRLLPAFAGGSLLVAALSAAPAPGGRVGDDPCPRKAERAFGPGEVVVLKDEAAPCRVTFVKTGVRLTGIAGGSRPDPGRTVLRDSKGRFYSANARGFPSVVSVWDRGGRYLRSFGREGEGPGEFSAKGALTLFMDGRDRLHVRDGGLGWSVFTPESEFVRRVPAHLMDVSRDATLILDDGAALTSARSYGERSNYFLIIDSAGGERAAFGPVEAEVARSRVSLARRKAYAGGSTFWAGPVSGETQAYLLEEWGVDGKLRRAFRREVPWYEWRGEERISPSVVQLHVTETGLLIVSLFLPTKAYGEAYDRAEREGRLRPSREERLALAEVAFEVIDARSGVLLASERYGALKVRREVPPAYFRGGTLGYVYSEEGEGGLPMVEMVKMELKAK